MAKHIVKAEFSPWRQITFRIPKGAPDEQEIVLHFGRRVRYQMVKLSTSGLPSRTPQGKKIRWISNWGIVDSRGKYVEHVRYTVFLRKFGKKQNFVYYYGGRLRWDKVPKYKGSKPPRPGWVQVDFEIGDPPGGLT